MRMPRYTCSKGRERLASLVSIPRQASERPLHLQRQQRSAELRNGELQLLGQLVKMAWLVGERVPDQALHVVHFDGRHRGPRRLGGDSDAVETFQNVIHA